jgi:hypothetical protein
VRFVHYCKWEGSRLVRSFARWVALPLALAGICLLGMEQSPRTVGSARAVRVLFIGNSLTYVNDVPGIVAVLAEAAGETAPVCRAVVGGGLSLEDHWNRGEAVRALEQEKWDFVVLQQGPSTSPEGRALLLRYARRFVPLIRKADAKTAAGREGSWCQRQDDRFTRARSTGCRAVGRSKCYHFQHDEAG